MVILHLVIHSTSEADSLEAVRQEVSRKIMLKLNKLQVFAKKLLELVFRKIVGIFSLGSPLA